jgi:hypothetical protein
MRGSFYATLTLSLSLKGEGMSVYQGAGRLPRLRLAISPDVQRVATV